MAAVSVTYALAKAAEVFARQARLNAAGWSARIPPSIRITVSGTVAEISSSAPPAYPNEIAGVRHPVFGGRGTKRPRAPWVTNQHRPFLAPAADQAGDGAAKEFGDVLIDSWTSELGYHLQGVRHEDRL